MQILNNSKIDFRLFGILIVVFLIGLSACSPAPSPTPNPPPTAEENSFLFTSLVTALHKIGESPCPQEIAKIATFCGRKNDSCTADSVVITNPSTGLDAKFENGKQSTSLDDNPLSNKTLIIHFNCQIAMSFDHTYKLVFYKNRVKVDEQSLGVQMTVQ